MQQQDSYTHSSPLAWVGVFYKVLGCALFALVNGLVRGLTGGASCGFLPIAEAIPFAQLAFLQNALGTGYMLPLAKLEDISSKVPDKLLHSARVISAALGMLCWYAALKFMPLAYAMALSFTGPILTIAASWIILKEPMTPFRVMAFLLSFVGSLIISKTFYGLGEQSPFPAWAAVLPLLSALFWAMTKICTRMLALKGATARSMTLYLVLFMTPITLLFTLQHWVWPTGLQWMLISGLAFITTLAHWTMSHAFKYADISFLMPFGFARFFFSWIVGFVFFGEFPTQSSLWIGTGVILVSLYLLAQDQKRQGIPVNKREALL